VRNRPAREIGCVRRHRGGVSRQGRRRRILATPGQRRKLGAGPAGDRASVPIAGTESVRVGTAGARRAGRTMMTETRTEDAGLKTSWVPMVSLFLAQVLMSFNVAALPISLGGMVEDFGVPPTIASSTIVVYGLAVAALVMTGAKLGQRVGWVLIFRVVIVLFAGSSLMMILAPTVAWAITGQAVAGAAAAIIVPALVALIAENYRGTQQATAIGALGSARAISGVSAFLIGGTLG